jgi:BASS family bile acid:Na+ symporter
VGSRTVDSKHLVVLALQLSILGTVFGFGLKTSLDDLLYLVRRPGLLLRSLVAVFVVMPIVAVVLANVFPFSPTAEIALVALSISPMPPLLPNRLVKAGGSAPFGLALMAMLAVLSIVFVPAAVQLLGVFYHRPFAMSSGAIAKIIVVMAFLPLASGMLVRALAPAAAARIEKPVGLASLVLLGHPAIAFSIASANFPDQHLGATILLYLLLGILAGIPYTAWLKRRAPAHAVA